MRTIYIQADQLRFDCLGAVGNASVISPNLDRMAKEGTIFTTAYCTSPLCCPSRSSVLTGLYPQDIDCYGNGTPYEGGHDTYPLILRRNGIKPYSIGRMDFAPGCNHGFEYMFEGTRHTLDPGELLRNIGYKRSRHTGYRSYCLEVNIVETESHDQHMTEMLSFLEEHQNDDDWHLFLNFFQPHPPYNVPKRYFEMYEGVDLPSPIFPDGNRENAHSQDELQRTHWDTKEAFSKEEIALRTRVYYAMITWLDDMVGQILDKLLELDMQSETCIIFSSDHGECLGERGMWEKGRFYDEPSRVPLIMWGKNIPSAAKVKTPVSLIDIAPTILDLHGVETPKSMRASSLLPLLSDQNALHHDVFGEYHAHDCAYGQYMIRDAKHKYIAHAGAEPQLYLADSVEDINLAEDEAYADLCKEYENKIAQHFGDIYAEDERIKQYQRKAFIRHIKNTSVESVRKELSIDCGEENFKEIKEVFDKIVSEVNG